MTDRRIVLLMVTVAVAGAVWLWLSYAVEYRRGRDETIARLVLKSREGTRARLLREEGVSNA